MSRTPEVTVEDSSYALYWSRRHMEHHSLDERRGYWVGYLMTPHGTVCVYAEYGGALGSMTRLDIVHRGRQHTRTIWGRCLTKRSLSIAAKKFAGEVTLATAAVERAVRGGAR